MFVKIAHRGASAYEPENTIRSFERAIGMKAEMLEFEEAARIRDRIKSLEKHYGLEGSKATRP